MHGVNVANAEGKNCNVIKMFVWKCAYCDYDAKFKLVLIVRVRV